MQITSETECSNHSYILNMYTTVTFTKVILLDTIKIVL